MKMDKIETATLFILLTLALLLGGCGMYQNVGKPTRNENKVVNKHFHRPHQPKLKDNPELISPKAPSDIQGKKVNAIKSDLPQNVDKTKSWKLSATYYNAVEKQCDSHCFETADGSIINFKYLKQNKIKWCALSRNLINNDFTYKEIIFIKELNCYYEIHDTMNKRFKNKIDILQDVTHKPLKFTQLTIYKVKV